jgi:hypothetical protein
MAASCDTDSKVRNKAQSGEAEDVECAGSCEKSVSA